MGNIFGGGSNLPPGCRVSDIPGNRPEGLEWETIIENFWDKKRIKKDRATPSTRSRRVFGHIFRRRWPKISSPREYALQDAINEYIDMAIEYGMELGRTEERNNRAENDERDKLYREMVRANGKD